MPIRKIQDVIKTGEYRYSDHSVKRMIQRHIEIGEIEETICAGEIIERYPDDKYSPSCLIYGQTSEKRNLHVQVSLPPKVVIITAYEPDEEEWMNFRTGKRERGE